MKKSAWLALAVGVFVATACNDSDTSTKNNTASTARYNLSKLTDPATTIQMDLEGTNHGTSVVGTYLTQYVGDTTYHGTTLAVRENVYTINGETLSTNTGYYQGTQFGVRNTERTCTIDDVSHLPPAAVDVSVGYHSNVTFNCTDGAIYQIDEALVQADDRHADYIVTHRVVSGNTTLLAEQHTYTVTPDMHVVGYEGAITGGKWDLHLKATQISQN